MKRVKFKLLVDCAMISRKLYREKQKTNRNNIKLDHRDDDSRRVDAATSLLTRKLLTFTGGDNWPNISRVA